jgi:hypothetical protein
MKIHARMAWATGVKFGGDDFHVVICLLFSLVRDGVEPVLTMRWNAALPGQKKAPLVLRSGAGLKT